MSKITGLHVKNTWFSNAKAHFNLSSRFPATYFSTKGLYFLQQGAEVASAPLGPLL